MVEIKRQQLFQCLISFLTIILVFYDPEHILGKKTQFYFYVFVESIDILSINKINVNTICTSNPQKVAVVFQ